MSQSPSVTLNFPYTLAYRATLEIVLRSPTQLVTSAAFPLAGIYLLYLWISKGHAIGPFDVLLLLACFMFTPIVTAITLYLARRRNPMLKGPFTYLFDEAGIHIAGGAFNIDLKWSAISRVRESKSFLFLYYSPIQAHCLPIKQMNEQGVLGAVRQIIGRHTSVLPPNNSLQARRP